MKKLLPILLFLASCSVTKVAKITSEKTPLTSEGFVYETDTVKITYRFWDNKGRMEYDIYNKLPVPIYIDWKSSAFIPNDKMVSYWQDVTNTEGAYASSAYLVRGYSISSGGRSSSKSIRAERIAVIPPESLITQKDYTIVKSSLDLPTNGDFNKTNSPLRFRNYLTISTNEKFEGKGSSVNNIFYINSVSSLKSDKYLKHKSQNSFYVPVKYGEKPATVSKPIATKTKATKVPKKKSVK